MSDHPWTEFGYSRREPGLNWPLIGMLALNGVAWVGIVGVAFPLVNRILS